MVAGHRIRLRQQGRTLRYSGADEDFIRHYLALDLDLDRVLAAIDTDPVIGAAIEACHGLRVLRQPLFECLVSYLCATNTNIPAVRSRVETLADHFGQRVAGEGICSFPSPRALGSASEADLRACRLGYRARYVRSATATVLAEPRWEDEVRALPHEAARNRLMALPGIGPKAADCILLFALDHLEAFPVDVWIHRIIDRHYRVGVDRATMTPAVYEEIRRFGQTRFGRYAGYAQEYLYGARSLLCPG